MRVKILALSCNKGGAINVYVQINNAKKQLSAHILQIYMQKDFCE